MAFRKTVTYPMYIQPFKFIMVWRVVLILTYAFGNTLDFKCMSI